MATMGPKMIALACCRRKEDSARSDLYPDPDAGPIEAALSVLGVPARRVAWDDPTVDWSYFSKVLITSTWDSVDRPVEYLSWARHTAEVSTLVNPVSVVEWDLDKVHQRALAEAGVPLVPTTWIFPGEQVIEAPATEFVVKPSISAGGRNTARYAAGDPTGLALVRELQRAGHTVMIQPCIESIDQMDETDLVFLEGRFSHAIAKRPLLSLGAGALVTPWEFISYFGLVEPRRERLQVATRTIEAISEQLNLCPTYARIDLVSDALGRSLLLEAELIDPYLSLDVAPRGAELLATALTRSE
jgi:hypothetical protein